MLTTGFSRIILLTTSSFKDNRAIFLIFFEKAKKIRKSKKNDFFDFFRKGQKTKKIKKMKKIRDPGSPRVGVSGRGNPSSPGS